MIKIGTDILLPDPQLRAILSRPDELHLDKMPKPTIVAVHGAWHSPVHFEPLKKNLVSHGYKFVATLLPSMHYAELKQPPPSGIIEDIEAIQATTLAELEAHPDTDVVLLTHSYSSMPGSSAIENLDKKSRERAGFKNGISAFLVMTGLLVPAGLSGFDWNGGQIPPTIVMSYVPSPVDGKTEIELSVPNPDPGAIELFFHDVPRQDAEYYASILIPHVWSVYRAKVPFAGYRFIPTYFLICKNDRAVPEEWQRKIVDAADAERLQFNPDGGKIVVETVESGHSPYLSKVQETAEWIRRSLGEKF